MLAQQARSPGFDPQVHINQAQCGESPLKSQVLGGRSRASGIQDHPQLHREVQGQDGIHEILSQNNNNNKAIIKRKVWGYSLYLLYRVPITDAPNMACVPACPSVPRALGALCLRNLAIPRSERHSVCLDTLPFTFHPLTLWKLTWSARKECSFFPLRSPPFFPVWIARRPGPPPWAPSHPPPLFQRLHGNGSPGSAPLVPLFLSLQNPHCYNNHIFQALVVSCAANRPCILFPFDFWHLCSFMFYNHLVRILKNNNNKARQSLGLFYWNLLYLGREQTSLLIFSIREYMSFHLFIPSLMSFNKFL